MVHVCQDKSKDLDWLEQEKGQEREMAKISKNHGRNAIKKIAHIIYFITYIDYTYKEIKNDQWNDEYYLISN